MQSVALMVGVLVCFQLKHFVADYLLQPPWMLHGKGSLREPGGYCHAGLHALGSLPALLLAGPGLAGVLILAAAEFVVHYVIDYGKAAMSVRYHPGPDKQAYWAMHGADQLMHQLTYVALTFAALTWP